MAVAVLGSCGGSDDEGGGSQTVLPQPNLPDITPPTIKVVHSSVDITGVEKISIAGSELRVGELLVASWTDNVTKNCQVMMMFNGSAISSGEVASKEWTLTLTVTDEAGNSAQAIVKLVMEVVFPDLTVTKPEVNVFGGVGVGITDSQLLIGGEEVASWSDKHTKKCKAELSFNGREIKSGDVLSEPGKLTLTITNDQGKSSTAEIILTNEAVIGEAKIGDMQVDEEIDLLAGITFAEGATLVKTEIDMDGQRTEITDAQHFTPEYPGTCSIIFTVKGKNGDMAEIKADNLTIKPLDYKAMEISNINPEEILPIVWQVEVWDKKAYEHIEHLRVAEATRVRDMMRKYGTSNHSPEEYQQLMKRLNTGMLWEIPMWYDNYEIIWWGPARQPSEHAHDEWSILNTIINDQQTNFIIINYDNKYETLYNLAKNNPNSINIFWSSTWLQFDKKWEYEAWSSEKKKWQLRQNNLILFQSWSNTVRSNNILKNKICQESIDLPDEHSVYTEASLSNSKDDPKADIHLLLTFGTNKEWDVDLTDETTGSKFPIWFHDDVLFSWRSFPHKETDNKIHAESWNLVTSYTNYFNVSLMDICFQMFPEVKDVDELLNMVKSTALTNYIRRDNKTQKLILINPAWLIKKYIMPTNLPTIIQSSETISLNKWYYKWVIFDVPWAEVKINWQWITYNNTNKSIIKNQNPMNLEWRLNGSLLRKLWYKQGDTVKGQLIVVDDEWNGLNITKDVSIKMTQ